MREVRQLTPLLALLAAAACADAPEAGPPAGEAEVAAERPAEGAAEMLSPELISQLREEYPVLGRERAPEPQPSPDATPGQVPERFAGVLETVQGEATFYADQFEGQRTASGIPFRQNQLVAAHRAYPFGTLLRVTNLRNDRSVNVRVVDRGPFGSHASARNTVLDLSRRAATELDFVSAGRAQIRVEVLEWGNGVPRNL